MTKSLRARLFVGLTAVILLAGCIGGAFTYLWAFDEAIEMQDSILIQIGSLLQNGSVKSDQSLRGVDADAEVDVTELGAAPHGPAEERHPFIASINGLLERMKLMMDQQRRFVADAAHELRTPITALSLQAENLDPADLPEQARERLGALKQGMRRTKHLLEQLLALARHEAGPNGEATVVPLDRTVKELVADLVPDAARKGIDLGFQLIEPLATKGEPVMIATMIRNLLDNAVRFTQQGGRVDIGVYRD